MSHPRTRLTVVAALVALAAAAAPSGRATGPAVRAAALVQPATTPVADPAPDPAAAMEHGARDLPYVPDEPAPAPPRVVPVAPEHPAWHAGQYRYRTVAAAMRALARVYNRHDVTALRSMANPSAVQGLEQMRREAVDLRLVSCRTVAGFGLMCSFSHGFPATLHRSGRGTASMQPGYDAKHGWYLAGSVECG
jgi:predicted lipid-binding transport protein (Tim44 family)